VALICGGGSGHEPFAAGKKTIYIYIYISISWIKLNISINVNLVCLIYVKINKIFLKYYKIKILWIIFHLYNLCVVILEMFRYIIINKSFEKKNFMYAKNFLLYLFRICWQWYVDSFRSRIHFYSAAIYSYHVCSSVYCRK